MKQKSALISLRNFTIDNHPYGNAQGKDVFRKLADFVDQHPQCKVFGISLSEIEATDASFPRESVVSIAKQYRGEKGFYLEGFQDRQDLIDNWDYAALAKDQSLMIWDHASPRIIGSALSSSNQAVVKHVIEKKEVTAANVAAALNISVPNASSKLKKLVDQGLILRSEETAASGGIEYIYHAIK